MKELTIEEKTKRYDEAIDTARKINSGEGVAAPPDWTICEVIFPELKESEESKDERVRKELIDAIHGLWDNDALPMPLTVKRKDNWLAWIEKSVNKLQVSAELYEHIRNTCACIDDALSSNTLVDITDYLSMAESSAKSAFDMIEKQGKQKSADKIEPKFKVGDWITNGQLTCKVLGITSKSYELHLYNDDYCHFETDIQSVDKDYHLWSIKDARNGDVLISIGFHSDCTFIFKGLDNWKFDELNEDKVVATGYCCLSVSADKMEFDIQGPDCIEVATIKPATKIQRDLLFQNMKEAGWEWDAEKKELKKFPNALEECEIEDIEHGKYYYCIKDYYSGGCKRASKGEVVQALRGMSMMALGVKANEYFIPVKCIIGIKPTWSEDDEHRLEDTIFFLNTSKTHYENTKAVDDCVTWLKSFKQRI